MKRLFLLLFLLIECFRISAQNKFELLWQENFDSAKIDYSRWRNDYRWGRSIVNNPEQEYYTDGKNFDLNDGFLTITAHKENINARVDSSKQDDALLSDTLANLRAFNYTSGLLCSRQKFMFGKFEMRCRLPRGNGTWPAFWLFGGPCGEIDIFERPWQFHYSITNNIQYDSAGHHCGDFRFTELDTRNTFSKEFHTYAVEWTPDSVSWLIDGIVVRVAEHRYKNCEMELIVNLAISDDDFWGTPPIRKRWKANFTIDYIKVWRLKPYP
jgi:beta-glucanase (GH16 family)